MNNLLEIVDVGEQIQIFQEDCDVHVWKNSGDVIVHIIPNSPLFGIIPRESCTGFNLFDNDRLYLSWRNIISGNEISIFLGIVSITKETRQRIQELNEKYKTQTE
jgi:hypothetical protein